jgi:hypothetical protein
MFGLSAEWSGARSNWSSDVLRARDSSIFAATTERSRASQALPTYPGITRKPSAA